MEPQEIGRPAPLGAAAAAILASSLGCLGIGIATLLAQISPTVATWLNWWSPVGPLSGESGVGIIAWLASWILLHFIMRKHEAKLGIVALISFLFIALAMVLLFPPFYQNFRS